MLKSKLSNRKHLFRILNVAAKSRKKPQAQSIIERLVMTNKHLQTKAHGNMQFYWR